jgi:hypothetical protein
MVIVAGAVGAAAGVSDFEAEQPTNTRIANVDVRTLMGASDEEAESLTDRLCSRYRQIRTDDESGR